tara:strand:+ start:137 stop:400 length:264 start_codon:yes stop_codon:yes gene_type:complete
MKEFITIGRLRLTGAVVGALPYDMDHDNAPGTNTSMMQTVVVLTEKVWKAPIAPWGIKNGHSPATETTGMSDVRVQTADHISPMITA